MEEIQQGRVVLSLDYSLMDKPADKDILLSEIVAIERRDSNTIAVKLRGGYTAFVTPKVGQQIQEAWHQTAQVIHIKG